VKEIDYLNFGHRRLLLTQFNMRGSIGTHIIFNKSTDFCGKMTEPAKIEYFQLVVGFEFPTQRYTMDQDLISLYLDATRDSSELYRTGKLVPPMAVTAYAMNALSQAVALPSGTIHVSQELDFLKTVKVGDTIVCYSKVSRKVDRGGIRLINIDLTVTNQSAELVLTGKVGFILP